MTRFGLTRSALAAAAIAAATVAPALAQTPGGTGPAEKKDSGSLSSGQKSTSPSTRLQGENKPVGSTDGSVIPENERGASGSSSGEAGRDVIPGTRKGEGTSDPEGMRR